MDSAFHLGTNFDGVAVDFFAGERDCERVWTPSRAGSSASCDCVGVSAITSRCGLSSRSSASVAALAGPSAVDAGSTPGAPDAESRLRSLPFSDDLPLRAEAPKSWRSP